jgi:hypothetical protein
VPAKANDKQQTSKRIRFIDQSLSSVRLLNQKTLRAIRLGECLHGISPVMGKRLAGPSLPWTGTAAVQLAAAEAQRRWRCTLALLFARSGRAGDQAVGGNAI